MRVSVRLVLAAIAVAGLVMPSGAAAWTWPVDGPVLRPFSFGSDPYAAGQHRGIDIGSPSGTPVVAPAGGKTVTILTPTGYAATLVHLGSIRVLRGTTIEEGAAVGTVGPSGVPDIPEPYVYFGIRVASDDQGYLDPLLFLPPRPQLPAPPAAVEPAPPPVSEAPAPAEQAPSPDPAATPSPAEAPTEPPAAEPSADPAPAPAPSADEPAAPAADGSGAASEPEATEPAEDASSSEGSADAGSATTPGDTDASGSATAPTAEPVQVDEQMQSDTPPAPAETTPSASEAETTPQPAVDSVDDSAAPADEWARRGSISAHPLAPGVVATGTRPSSRTHVRVTTTDSRAPVAAQDVRQQSPQLVNARGTLSGGPAKASHAPPAVPRQRGDRPSVVRHRGEPSELPRGALEPLSVRRGTQRPSSTSFPSLLGLASMLCGALVAAVAAALALRRRRPRPGAAPAGAEAARMMVIRGGAEAEANPGGACVAVRSGPTPPGTRDRLRGSGRHLRALPPTPGERRPDGERNRRARDAGDGGGGQRGHIAA